MRRALEEIAAAVRKTGAEPLSLAVDLSQVEAPEMVIKATLERFGQIDALLNIAGAVPQIDLFEMTDEEWKAGMELKLHGARRLTSRAWDALKTRSRFRGLYVRECRSILSLSLHPSPPRT